VRDRAPLRDGSVCGLACGIPTSRIEVDSAAIRTAADTAVTLWPDDPYCGDDS
jgi:hypothetical protein